MVCSGAIGKQPPDYLYTYLVAAGIDGDHRASATTTIPVKL